jgi:uncharacterized protein with von Willebrand factor type A (vWA) domain
MPKDKLDEYRVYQLARQLFDEFWQDAEVMQRDVRGFGKEYPQSLRISRGEARERRGRYERMRHLLPKEIVDQRTAALDQIIGGLTATISTLESNRRS